MKGHPHRTRTGELSIKATALPEILTPCMRQTTGLENAPDSTEETHFVERHVDMLTSGEISRMIVQRSRIIRTMRKFFESRDFVEVETPILAAAAGGATARPFETIATEFSDRKLALRIAPELWLKRLVIGGMQKVFEIGPSFRNEGM